MKNIPGGKPTPSSELQAYQNAMNKSMDAMMDSKIPIHHDVDKDFLQQMIPHHQGAVEMAKAYLKFAKNPALISMNENIIRTQNAEITWMKAWLQQHA